jgi:hypothetical protein
MSQRYHVQMRQKNGAIQAVELTEKNEQTARHRVRSLYPNADIMFCGLVRKGKVVHPTSRKDMTKKAKAVGPPTKLGSTKVVGTALTPTSKPAAGKPPPKPKRPFPKKITGDFIESIKEA